MQSILFIRARYLGEEFKTAWIMTEEKVTSVDKAWDFFLKDFMELLRI